MHQGNSFTFYGRSTGTSKIFHVRQCLCNIIRWENESNSIILVIPICTVVKNKIVLAVTTN